MDEVREILENEDILVNLINFINRASELINNYVNLKYNGNEEVGSVKISTYELLILHFLFMLFFFQFTKVNDIDNNVDDEVVNNINNEIDNNIDDKINDNIDNNKESV